MQSQAVADSAMETVVLNLSRSSTPTQDEQDQTGGIVTSSPMLTEATQAPTSAMLQVTTTGSKRSVTSARSGFDPSRLGPKVDDGSNRSLDSPGLSVSQDANKENQKDDLNCREAIINAMHRPTRQSDREVIDLDDVQKSNVLKADRQLPSRGSLSRLKHSFNFHARKWKYHQRAAQEVKGELEKLVAKEAKEYAKAVGDQQPDISDTATEHELFETSEVAAFKKHLDNASMEVHTGDTTAPAAKASAKASSVGSASNETSAPAPSDKRKKAKKKKKKSTQGSPKDLRKTLNKKANKRGRQNQENPSPVQSKVTRLYKQPVSATEKENVGRTQIDPEAVQPERGAASKTDFQNLYPGGAATKLPGKFDRHSDKVADESDEEA